MGLGSSSAAFELMGKRIAEFVNSGEKTNQVIPGKLTIR